MDVLDEVRIWRPDDRVLLMRGRTAGYAIEPRGEYVFGLVERAPMRARRAGARHDVAPGQLVAWDPSGTHSGRAVDGRPWAARLMLVEAEEVAALGGAGVIGFGDPVLADPGLAAAFAGLHDTLAHPTTRLERDEGLAEWLRAVAVRHARAPAPVLRGRDAAAFRRARDRLREAPARNVGLDELAGVAGVDKFRLIRLFRDATGQPPHAFQVAERVRRARRLLEAGETIAGAAALTGFADQSHLHRHFRRSIGCTPAEYRRRFAVR